MVIEGMGPKDEARVFTMAAPVGVVSSNGAVEAATGTPFNISRVAGAGMGMVPCIVLAQPVPSAIGEDTILLTLSESTAMAAPQMSIIESIAPISWKWTSSAFMPCILPSDSAMTLKMAVERVLTAG